MFERLRSWLLRILRVPPEPEPPSGDPRSIRMFRASRKLYYLRLFRWGVGQFAALAAIAFWLGVLTISEHEAGKLKQGRSSYGLSNLQPGQNRITTEPLRYVPRFVFQLLWVAKAAGTAVYLAQLLITYVGVRLDYELRWYIVTDRSLRIRSGLFTVQEITMSFANLQQVAVSQGPLQRLLGISDVRVESAGGGGSESSGKTPSQSMHAGVFHGVDNATYIRDLILERLRHFRESGLGDPDETGKRAAAAHSAHQTDVALNATTRSTAITADVLMASRELLEEARQLRAAFQ